MYDSSTSDLYGTDIFLIIPYYSGPKINWKPM